MERSINSMPDFTDIKYERPDIDAFMALVKSLRLKLMTTKDVEVAKEVLFEYEKNLSHIFTQFELCNILHDLDTSNEFYSDELECFEEISAKVEEMASGVMSVMLNCPCSGELRACFGDMIFLKAENSKKQISSAVVDDIVNESNLENDYAQLQSEAEIEFNGEILNLSMLEPYLESTNRKTRIEAFHKLDEYYMGRKDTYGDIFDKLVKVRTEIAHKLGFKNFTELGYVRMERYDYNADDVKKFRDNVVKYIVPISVQIRKNQAKHLDLDKLMFYDQPCLFKNGNPRPQIKLENYNKVSGEFFAKIFETTPSFFDVLSQHGFTDLISRRNKSTGGYCMYLDDYAIPFIFMNGNGTADDVSTIVHEGGHAYAAVKSAEVSPFMECTSPTLETCEIHSTAMEFLSYRFMDMFYGTEADKYCQLHMTNAMLFISYGCMVDEFQHIIYDNPELTPDERNNVWKELENKYQPGINYDNHPFHEQGCAWMKKDHIFTSPFYYIDYCLSHIVALSLWDESQQDFKEAMIKYNQLCELGGTDTFKKLLEAADLPSPFDTDVIKKLAYSCCRFLEL